MNINKKKLGIYIHIPFCKRKCAYCDFLSGPATVEVQDKYMEQLLSDIKSMENKEQYEVDTVFIGGGTPSVVSAKWIFKLMETLKAEFRVCETAEISIEANPGTVTKESLEIYRKSGINRISFGVQSMEDKELELLGRIHRREDFLQVFYLAREAGFTNINVDLMSALPGQTVDSFTNTLKEVAKLEPEHISVYSLIIEEGTRFYEEYREDELIREQGLMPKWLPSEEAEREMYENTREILAEHGFYRYEISNYAKEGFACKHNLKYWDRKEYMGFGIGAASLLKESRFKKTESLTDYLHGDFEKKDVEQVSQEEAIQEFMFLGLRKTAGISKQDFYQSFHKELEDVYGNVLKKLVKDNLLIETKVGYALTEQGLDVSNRVFAEFL